MAERNWQLQTFAQWQIELLERGPQCQDNMAQNHSIQLNGLVGRLSERLIQLVIAFFAIKLGFLRDSRFPLTHNSAVPGRSTDLNEQFIPH